MINSNLAILLLGADSPLSENERREAFAFAADLFAGAVNGAKAATPHSLGRVHSFAPHLTSCWFFLSYFDTPEGRADRALLGLPPEADELMLGQLLLVSTAKNEEELVQLKVVAQRSKKWHRQHLAELLLQDKTFDTSFETLARVVVQYRPTFLLEKLEGLAAFYRFYQQLASLPGESALDRAKRALVKVHLDRARGLLQEQSGAAELLELQLRASDDEVSRQLLKQLEALAPVLAEVIQPVAHNAVQQLSTFLVASEVKKTLTTHFSSGQLQHLHATYWNASQMKALFEAVLQKWGLLSSYPANYEEAEARSGPAPDGLFQVVIRPHKKGLGVWSEKRAVLVPASFNRSLTSLYPAGVLAVAAHELTHVLQALADAELAKKIPLASIKGHRYRTGREAGAVFQENWVQEQYLGRERPNNKHYARAMKVKYEGGTQLAVIRAFYNSYTEGKGGDEAARLLAVDRALRLYRRVAFNTTPADMIEQADVLRQLYGLPLEQAAQFAIAGSSFSPQDARLLHQAGLLELPNFTFTPARDVIEVFENTFQNLANEYNGG